MKKKNRKQGKVRLRVRRVSRAVRGKRRAGSRKEQVERKPTQWLRMIPTRIEDELEEYTSGGLFSDRKDGHQSLKLDLRLTEVK